MFSVALVTGSAGMSGVYDWGSVVDMSAHGIGLLSFKIESAVSRRNFRVGLVGIDVPAEANQDCAFWAGYVSACDPLSGKRPRYG